MELVSCFIFLWRLHYLHEKLTCYACACYKILAKVDMLVGILTKLFCSQVSSFIGLIIIIASGLSARGTAFIVAAIGALIVSCFYILIYVTTLAAQRTELWLKSELLFALVWGIFYLTVSILVISTMSSPYIAAGVSVHYYC